MPNFKVKTQKHFEVRENEDYEIKITVPDILPLSSASDLKFKIVNQNGDPIFSKSKTEMNIVGQQITINIIPSDTNNKASIYKWGLQIFQPRKQTIGEGNFVILRKLF